MAETNHLRCKIVSEKKNPNRIKLYLCFDEKYLVTYLATKKDFASENIVPILMTCCQFRKWLLRDLEFTERSR